MYCSNCGTQLDDKAVICPHCGVPTGNFGKANGYGEPKKFNILAIVGFVLSFFVAIAGLVCSIIGYKNAPQYNGEGKNLALAGIIISIVEIVASVILVVIYVIVIIAALGLTYGFVV